MNDRDLDWFFIFWFVVCSLVGFTVLGVGIWAVIEFVNWVTSK